MNFVSIKIEMEKNFETHEEANKFLEKFNNNVKEAVIINNQDEQELVSLESFEIVEAVLHTEDDDINIF